MPNTTTALTAAGETYFADLGRVRASGGATGERSSYGPLANLLNAVGATLAPKVFCVGELADQGAGHPDFGLYAAKQVQQGRPREAQVPERGVVEVKAAGDDAWLTAAGDQVSRYWGRYRLVLVTNTRDFVLVGEDAAGRPTKLETFRLAADADTGTQGQPRARRCGGLPASLGAGQTRRTDSDGGSGDGRALRGDCATPGGSGGAAHGAAAAGPKRTNGPRTAIFSVAGQHAAREAAQHERSYTPP